MSVIKSTEVVRKTLAFELGNEAFSRLLDIDCENNNNDEKELYEILNALDYVVDADYDGMFVFRGVFVAVTCEDDNAVAQELEIAEIIENYLK